MRAILIVLIFPVAALGKDVDWTGGWSKEGGGNAVVRAQGGKLEVDEGMPSADGRSVAFTGSGSGTTLTLSGKLVDTVGYVGVIDGEKGRKEHDCTLVAQENRDGSDQVALVTYTLDGAPVRKETWRRPLPPIEIELDEGGKPLVGPIDGKLTSTGLQVNYTVNGSDPLPLTLEISVDAGHPCPEFYANPVLYTVSLGTVQPGKNVATWDVRDRTAAARIAIQGSYKARVSASPTLKAEASFTVAAPRSVVGGTPVGAGIPGGATGTKAILSPSLSGKGYDASTPAATTPDAISQAVGNAAFAVLHAHGRPEALEIGSVNSHTRLGASAFGDLKDLHVAVVVACWTASSPRDGTRPFLQTIHDKGCDVAIGFSTSVLASEALGWVNLFLGLLERGSPIAKTADDAARDTIRQFWTVDPGLTDAAVDQLVADLRKQIAANPTTEVRPIAAGMTVLYGSGVDSSEQYWPPRYGNSKN